MTSDASVGAWIGALGALAAAASLALLGWSQVRGRARLADARRQAEAAQAALAGRLEALEAHSLMLRAREAVLAHNPRLGFFGWTSAGDALELSAGAAALLGRRPDDAPTTLQALRLLAHPVELDALDEGLNTLLQGRAARLELELRLHHADGSWRWTLLQAEAASAAGEATAERLVGTLTDVHALKLAEDALAADRRLFDTGPVIVATFDRALPHRLRSLSASAPQRLGHPRGTVLVGKPLAELLDPEDLQACQAELARVGSEPGASFQREVRLRRGDGGPRWHSLHALVAGPEGQTLRAYLVDVEDLKRAERAAAEQAQQLQGVVEKLTQTQGYTERLRELSELVQCATTEDEALDLVARWAPALLPGWAGALATPSVQGQLELRRRWGGLQAPGLIGHEDCWALRRSRPHAAHGPADGVGQAAVCAHFPAGLPAPAHSLCLPLAGLGGGEGLLLLEHAAPIEAEQLRPADLRARALAETVRLSLGNLQLRLSLQEQATRDWMTGLHNRRHFEELLPRELNRARRGQEALTLAMIDIDHFKSYNDRFGHDAGDTVIRSVAAQLAGFGRPYDLRCRLGGEELGILMPGIQAVEALGRLEELREQIASTPVVHAGRELPPVTVSIGLAEPSESGPPAELLRRADIALYAAKRSGRDRCVPWDPGLESLENPPAAA